MWRLLSLVLASSGVLRVEGQSCSPACTAPSFCIFDGIFARCSGYITTCVTALNGCLRGRPRARQPRTPTRSSVYGFSTQCADTPYVTTFSYGTGGCSVVGSQSQAVVCTSTSSATLYRYSGATCSGAPSSSSFPLSACNSGNGSSSSMLCTTGVYTPAATSAVMTTYSLPNTCPVTSANAVSSITVQSPTCAQIGGGVGRRPRLCSPRAVA